MDLSSNQFYLQDILEWVNENELTINLNSEKISFLLAIYLTQKSLDTELNEEVLIDLYRQVLSFNEQDLDMSDNALAARANKMINDMVTMKLLNRFNFYFNEDEEENLEDNANSIYRLSPLAIGISDNYFRQKEFSQVGLSVQLAMVAKEMNEITSKVDEVNHAHFWRTNIYAPLRFSVVEIFNLIDYRQRELDEEQQEVKERIAALLTKDWNAAIDTCKDLLDSTSLTLRELQDTLSSAGDKLQAQLSEINRSVNYQLDAIQNLRLFKEQPQLKETLYKNETLLLSLVEEFSNFKEEELVDLEEAFNAINYLVNQLQNKLDRILSWGQQNIDLWIGFDKHIHRFIRNTIDLDKNRVFSTRLRRSIAEFLDNPFYLKTIQQDRIFEMRVEGAELIEGEELGELPSEMEFEEFDNIHEQISLALRKVILPYQRRKEPLDIALVLRQILHDNPLSMHFDVARIFIEQAMQLGVSIDENTSVQAIWKEVNEHHAEVQASVINHYPN